MKCYLKDGAQSDSLRAVIQSKGLEKCLSSDITVVAFGTRYRLHRDFLKKSPFFQTALSPRWEDKSTDEFRMYPETADWLITQGAFENALMYLYEMDPELETLEESEELLALSCFFLLDNLSDHCIENIVRLMTDGDIPSILALIARYEGTKAAYQLQELVKDLVCIRGSDLALEIWDYFSPDGMVDLLSSDFFHVASEWDRYQYGLLLLNRNLVQARDNRDVANVHGRNSGTLPIYEDPMVVKLRSFLQENIRYFNIPFNLLQRIRTHRDIFGARILPGDLLDSVVWRSVELHQKIIHAGSRNIFLSGVQNLYPLFDGEPAAQQYQVSKADRVLFGGAEWPCFVSRSGGLGQGKRIPDQSVLPDTRPFPPARLSLQFPSPQRMKVGREYQSRPLWHSGSMWRMDTFISELEPRILNIRVYRIRPSVRDERCAVDFATESVYRKMINSASQSDDLTGTPVVVNAACAESYEFFKNITFMTMLSHRESATHHAENIVLPGDGESCTVSATGLPPDSEDVISGEELRTSKVLPFIDPRTFVPAYCRLYSNLAPGSKMTTFETKVEAISLHDYFGWQVDLDSINSSSHEDKHSTLRFALVLGIL